MVIPAPISPWQEPCQLSQNARTVPTFSKCKNRANFLKMQEEPCQLSQNARTVPTYVLGKNRANIRSRQESCRFWV